MKLIKRSQALLLICTALFTLHSSFTTLPKGDDELEMLKKSTLVVVLLEENPKIVTKYKHKPPQLAAYQNDIKSYNENIKALASKYLSISAGITFKTMSEVVSLPQSEREGYSYLVYNRATQFGVEGVPNNFAFDFYASQQEELQGMSDDYRELINFDAADPKFHGEGDYRKLEVYAKSKKKASVLMFTESLDMIIPTKGSLALCLTAIQKQFNDVNNPEPKLSKDAAREAAFMTARANVAKARRKTLLVWKDNLDKMVTEAKIKPNYEYNFKIVSREDFDQAILNKDTSCTLLIIYAASKTQGAFRAAVNYEHRIVDAETYGVLVTATPQAKNGAMPPSYQKINDKQFKDLVTTEDDMSR